MSGAAPSTFWRLAGLSYIQYVTKATTTLRAGLKEPAKTAAMRHEAFEYNAATWSKGVEGVKAKTTTVPSANPL